MHNNLLYSSVNNVLVSDIFEFPGLETLSEDEKAKLMEFQGSVGIADRWKFLAQDDAETTIADQDITSGRYSLYAGKTIQC